MRKKILFSIYMAALGLVFVHCTKMDDYKQFIPDGELIYPQKADSLKAYPGKNRIMLEWQIIDPKVNHCKVFWHQEGEEHSVKVPIDSDFDYTTKSTDVIIDNLGESNYIFKVISFDKLGNSSIPVEIEENSYGEIYEASLVNRVIKNKEYQPESGLTIEWHNVEESMIHVVLSYTNMAKEPKTITVPNESSSSFIPDFNPEFPISYTTLHKPDSSAIDIFNAPPLEERVRYYANISHLLQNTGDPFQLGNMVFDNRFYSAPGWKTNAVGGRNGNVDVLKNSPKHGLTLWAWSGYSPLPGYENGKLFQTIALEKGTYRFDAVVNNTSTTLNRAYIVAALGDDLPDIADISSALSTTAIPNDIKEGNMNKPTLSVEFTLTEKSNVSLGFLANIGHAQEIVFRKVELYEQK